MENRLRDTGPGSRRHLCWPHVSSALGSLKIPDSTSLRLLGPSAISLPVLSSFRRRLRAAATAAADRIRSAFREATRPLPLVAGFAMDLTRSRGELLAENALLRQQLIVASRKVKRPAFRPHERGLLVLLCRLVHNWRNAVLVVKPDTILRWHREGFRLFWRLKSRKPSKPQPRLSADVIELIRRPKRTVACRRMAGPTRRVSASNCHFIDRNTFAVP